MGEDGVNRTDRAGDDRGVRTRGDVSVPVPRTEKEADATGRRIECGTTNTGVASGGVSGPIDDAEPGSGASGAGTSRAASSRRATGSGERTPSGETVAAREAGDLGRVSLIGAGPGHPDLLTRRAYERLAAADVVCYDSLTSDAVLADLPEGVDVVDVGKRPPNRTPQNEINALLCERSKRGEQVVRLKGGDPCLFGRGGEEAEHLASEGIPFEIVPGVSSALAAPGVGGIPLTHREHASSVTVITGHETPDKPDSALDWDALAGTVAAGGTLVILMGVARLPANVRALRDHGLTPETPAATIQKATWREEDTVVATVETIAERNRQAGIESPAVTIVGDVVSVREAVESSLLR